MGPRLGERTKDWLAALAAPLAIAAAAFAVPPVGEFPITDDWDYRDTVVEFLRSGQFRLSDWPAMPLLTHVLWGAPFAKVGGASYFTLRISSLAALALGSVALFLMARRLGAGRRWSVFGALALAFSPPVWLYACSFMTDVSGMALLLATALAAARCARSYSTLRHWLGLAAVAGLAYLDRQTSALPALALAAVCVRRQPWAVLAGFAAPFAALAASHWAWLQYIHGVPHSTTLARLDFGLLAQPRALAARVGNAALVFAFLAAPALLAPGAWPGRRHVRAWSAGLALALGLAWAAPAAPFHDSLAPWGLAIDRATPGFDAVGAPRRDWAPAVTLFGRGLAAWAFAAGFASLAARRREWRAAWAEPWRLSLALAAAAFFASLTLGTAAHDRYQLPLLALALPLWLAAARRDSAPSAAGWLLLAAYAAFGLTGTRDYFERQRAWWRAADALLARGVDPTDVNGNFEFAGSLRFAPIYRDPDGGRRGPFLLAAPSGPRELALGEIAPYSIVAANRRHAVAFAPLPGHEILESFPYDGWLTGPGAAYALRKSDPKNGGSP